MSALELRIPPLLVALSIAAAMWVIALLAPPLSVPVRQVEWAGLFLGAVGLAIVVAGVNSFRSAGTTVNPTRPEASTSLVSTGVYSLTRNPMYLGMLTILLGWAVYLSSVASLIGPAVFVLFITRFQIVPEERAMVALFGPAFEDYRHRVRRWL